MTRVGQYLTAARFAAQVPTHEGPAYFIRVTQRLAILASHAGLDADAKHLIRMVEELAHLRDIRAVQAWTAARRSLPIHKRVLVGRRPPRWWVSNHVAFDMRRADLDLGQVLEEPED